MTTHGKYCDFDFYVTSLDAENGYAATEPMFSGLSLLEAVSEFYKRCGRCPSSTNIMLGVEYTTSRRDLEPNGIGAADLLQRVNGALKISRDFEQSEVLKREGLIANNAVSFLKQQSENLYELSDKYTIECARKIAESLSRISGDPQKCRDLMAQLTGEYGLERCKVILANEYYGNPSGMLTPETSAYLDEACDRHDDRFNINAPPMALENLTSAVREIEGLSETENKILRAGLVNGDREQVQSHSAPIKSEIGHHNDLENNGLVPEDQWSL